MKRSPGWGGFPVPSGFRGEVGGGNYHELLLPAAVFSSCVLIEPIS